MNPVQLRESDATGVKNTIVECLSGSEKKGVESFCWPSGTDEVIDGDRMVQLKLTITWKRKEIFIHARVREKPNVKKSSLMVMGFVDGISETDEGFQIHIREQEPIIVKVIG